MSGFAGAFDPAGSPIDRDAFARTTARIAYRGRGGVECHYAPGVAMAFASFPRTPDAVEDRQPRTVAQSGITLTFDGRLDNRDDLSAELGVPLCESTCDSALAGAAYARWGADCAGRLLGDFSLVVCDSRQRRLFLARDVMGIRPLFHRELHNVWWWASDQRALLELAAPVINEGYVGEYLAGRLTSIDETIYTDIQRLPMGHALLVTAGSARRWRYWRPDADARLSYRDPRDYEQHFRTVLKEAVRARLRVHGNAALLLSGGIDSSSVAVQIAALRDEGHGPASGVTAFSMDVPGSPASETPVIRQVIDRVRLPSEMVSAREPSEEHFTRDAERSLDLPESPSSSMTQPLYDAAVRADRFVVLTGYGGDDWFESSYADLSDMVRGARVPAAARWLASLARGQGRDGLSALVRQGLWTALPDGARQAVRRVLRRSPVPFWIDPHFARRHNLADRLRQTPDEVPFGSIARYDRFRVTTGGEATLRGDHEERYRAARGLEQRHPLTDRRVIEFALALPADMRSADGVSKVVMRRAMSDALPAMVTATPRNDDFGFLGLRVLKRLGGSARLDRSQPVRRGWMSPGAVAELYGTLEAGATRALWPLCAVTTVDFWLCALGSAGPIGQERVHDRHAIHTPGSRGLTT